MENLLDKYIEREKQTEHSDGLCRDLVAKAKRQANVPKSKSVVRKVYYTSAVAACFAVALLLFIGKNPEPLFVANVPLTKQEVIEMAQESLSKLSFAIDETVAPLDKTNKKLGEIKTSIEK